MKMWMSFSDKDYDGVVIRLPKWFIDINHLDSTIENFRNELEEKCEFSLNHKDYLNSLYEMENYKNKSAIIKEENEKEKKYLEENKKLRLKYLSKEILPYHYKDYRFYRSNGYDFKFKDKTYTEDDFVMGRKTPNKKLFDEINSKIQKMTKEEFIDFCKSSGFWNMVYYLSDDVDDRYFKLGTQYLYLNTYLELSMCIQRMEIDYYVDTENYFQLSPTNNQSTKEWYIPAPRKKYEDIKDLTNRYKIKNGYELELIK